MLLLFVFSTSGVEHSTAKQCTAQQSTGSAQSSTAQSNTAQQSKAERQLSASASALCFLISSFCILLFCVSASVSCCCLKSFFDAYQNRNLIFPRTPARSLKGEPRGTLTISPQGFYAGLLGGVVVCTAIIAIFAAVTTKLQQIKDNAVLILFVSRCITASPSRRMFQSHD